MKEFIAYKGSKFIIEWYYNTNEKSQAFEYFQNLDDAFQDKMINLFALMAEIGLIKDKTKFRNEGDGIYAFKSRTHRFLSFFFIGKKIIITNAFNKKQDKLPINEKAKALKYKSDYEIRIKKGAYYD
ncbi:MAG: type II toxin-antitoxin system RelE/ParE family toxin [bacterium]